MALVMLDLISGLMMLFTAEDKRDLRNAFLLACGLVVAGALVYFLIR